uniref:Uncharacterized protein n=1 Tax=Oryza brachyantha TaxID=4533 RepID=J3MSV3_ORYBR
MATAAAADSDAVDGKEEPQGGVRWSLHSTHAKYLLCPSPSKLTCVDSRSGSNWLASCEPCFCVLDAATASDVLAKSEGSAQHFVVS